MARSHAHPARSATWFDDVVFVTAAERTRVDNENRFPRTKPKRRRRRSRAAANEPSNPDRSVPARRTANDGPEPSAP